MYLFIFAYLICAALYFPALRGMPIWDDKYFWFQSADMNLSYWMLARYAAWPLSHVVQKFLLAIFGETYLLYHLLNLSLHYVNSFLVYRLALALGWPRPRWIFLLFLFHPACVMAAGWIIQFKTLLCFLLATSGVLLYRSGSALSAMGAAALYLGAVLAKAAAVPLALALALRESFWRGRAKYFFLPAIVCGLLGAALLVARNPGIEAASLRTQNKAELVLQTARFYIEQSLLPLNTAPIKGRSPQGLELSDLFFWLVLALGCYKFRRNLAWFGLGMLMLSPFLGLVKAPFMTVTWVSDQHLYLALPMLLAFWMFVLERYPRALNTVCALWLGFFLVQTARTARYFSDEVSFYSASLASDPGNVIAAFNQVHVLLETQRVDEAKSLIEKVFVLAGHDPSILNHPHLEDLQELRRILSAPSGLTILKGNPPDKKYDKSE